MEVGPLFRIVVSASKTVATVALELVSLDVHFYTTLFSLFHRAQNKQKNLNFTHKHNNTHIHTHTHTDI